MKRILCPTDYSDAAAPAERLAVRVARSLDYRVTISADTPCHEAVRGLAQNRIRHVPVVDDDGRQAIVVSHP